MLTILNIGFSLPPMQGNAGPLFPGPASVQRLLAGLHTYGEVEFTEPLQMAGNPPSGVQGPYGRLRGRMLAALELSP